METVHVILVASGPCRDGGGQCFWGAQDCCDHDHVGARLSSFLTMPNGVSSKRVFFLDWQTSKAFRTGIFDTCHLSPGKPPKAGGGQ